MKMMGGMMGLPGMRRKATKSPKNKRKGGKASTGRRPVPGVPGGMPGGMGMPALPPGLDPSALDGGAGLPPGFKPPRLDFGKFGKRDDK
jgi:signal recognition particle subunit SRP54